jgi:hypothetical protein
MIKEYLRNIFHFCDGNRVFVRKEEYKSKSQFFRYYSTQTVTKCSICGDISTSIDWEAMKKVKRPVSEWGNND